MPALGVSAGRREPWPPAWFDAHLDLAYMAACGRDMLSADVESCGGPDLPASVTLPTLARGRMRACLATIFVESGGSNAASYPAGDHEAARRAALAQVAWYERWSRGPEEERGESAEGLVGFHAARPGNLAGLPMVLRAGPGQAPIAAGILMEGADPIADAEDLVFWRDRGVVAIGLAWVHGTRAAGGNATRGPLTDFGRDVVRGMDQLGLIHDVSHLSDLACDELLDATDRPVMASHSNCRALFMPPNDNNQRHLRDETIIEIGRRGGFVGVNLFSPFINPGASRQTRAPLEDLVRHVERLAALLGSRSRVGLGSDMDGGFPRTMLPAGIDGPADLGKLAEALAGAGWSEEEVRGFCWGNLESFLSRVRR